MIGSAEVRSRPRVGLMACETRFPPKGGPSVHVYQVWHRMQEMGFPVHAWGEQAVPGCRHYPRTSAGFAQFLDNVDVLYIRYPFERDFPAANYPRMLLSRRPVVYEFDAPLDEWMREYTPGSFWYWRRKAFLYGRNHLLVRRRVDHGICVSREMEAYIRQEFKVNNLTVLPNGGDPELFHPKWRAQGRAEMGVSEDDFVVFWGGVTKWYWQGLAQLMAAAEKCNARNIRFVVAGDPAFLPKPLPPNVVAIGEKSYFDIPRFMAGADVCLAIYRDYDWCPIGFYGSALKLFDYMSCGRPVIASALGQIREVVQDGVNGFLTDSTPEDLIEKVMRLHGDRALCERMGQAARETILASYNWQGVAERTAAIIDAAWTKAGRPRTGGGNGSVAGRKPTIGLFAAYGGGYGGTEEYLNKLVRPSAETGGDVVFFHAGNAPGEWVERVRPYARTVAYSNEAPARLVPAEARAEAGGNGNGSGGLPRALLPSSLRLFLGFARETGRLRRILRQHPVDVLHFNDLGPDPQIVAARLAGIPRITGVLNCLPSSDPRRSTWAHRILEALCFSCLDEIAAVSATGKSAWAQRTRLYHDDIPIIYNSTEIPALDGIAETSAAVRAELGVPVDARIVGVTARFDPRKGHAYLLDAFPAVLKAVPSAWLLLVGYGPIREELEGQARRLGVAERVRFLGHRPDAKRIAQAYDVVALTSTAIESLPFALLEGMAYGKPGVGTAVGGMPELIEEGVSGLIVPPRDSAAIADALIQLLGDPAKAARMGAAARERVRARFNADRMVQETLSMMLGTPSQRSNRR